MHLRHLTGLLLISLLAALPVAALHAQETLRILTWPGYADSDLVEEFASRYGVKVEVTFIDTDEVLRAKISRHQGGDYDVFAANTAEMQHYIDQQLVQPLQLADIPNTKRQLWRFRNLQSIPGISRDGTIYAVPYTFAEMGLIYDRAQFSSPPSSLASMWDPQYQGRVLAYDGATHNFSITNLLLGGAPFQIKDAEFAAVSAKLLELRRNVLTFYTLPQESVELFRQHKIALLYANYGRQQLKLLLEAGVDAGYVIPQEGALSWLDCWAVSRGAKNPRLAADWINFTLEPRISQELSRRQGLSNTLEAGTENSNLDKIIWLEPAEDDARRAQLWSRIRSGERLPTLSGPESAPMNSQP
ncbi:MAG: extracellular solute-binding protein [Pseudomonas sp.]|uniref:extracellular solute-binding protein n=1 Tax=Pseudomonas sp. TaxID=306 RepID=UPI0027330E6D|nr:extracellular solute-binding protein [Pseudomonas sp.]MDP3848324.1 extracellular solute-binding protein [Pseudomonas sp.]